MRLLVWPQRLLSRFPRTLLSFGILRGLLYHDIFPGCVYIAGIDLGCGLRPWLGLLLGSAGIITNSNSPSWHRRQRRRRSQARGIYTCRGWDTVFTYPQKSGKQFSCYRCITVDPFTESCRGCRRIGTTRRIGRSGHPDNGQKKGQGKGLRGENQPPKKGVDQSVVRGYDADGGASSTSGPSSVGGSIQQDGMQEFSGSSWLCQGSLDNLYQTASRIWFPSKQLAINVLHA